MASLATAIQQEEARSVSLAPRVAFAHSQKQHFVPAEALSPAHHHSTIDRVLRYAGIGSAAIALSPFVLRKLGVGATPEGAKTKGELGDFDFLARYCCPLIDKNSPLKFTAESPTTHMHTQYTGIAGAVAYALEHVPVVGGSLAKGDIENALAGGGLMVVGHYGGLGIERMARGMGGSGSIGRFLRDASQLLGVAVALPAILPGVGHGVQFLTAVAGIDHLDKEHLDASGPGAAIAGILGKVPGSCKGENKLTDSAKGAGGVLIAQLCCALPAIIASLPSILSPGRQAGQER
jgi:hypothetical protein